MHQKLPIEIDPFRLARNGLELEGLLAVKAMKRLSGGLIHNSSTVEVNVKFDVDKVLGTPYMEGNFKTSLPLKCERCGEALNYNLNIHCSLGIINSETKIEGLAEQYEPWVIDHDEPILLSAIVEDELILAIPLAPKHEYRCLPAEAWVSGSEFEESDDEIEHNRKEISPFAVLGQLKK